jgi:hypothetical protein
MPAAKLPLVLFEYIRDTRRIGWGYLMIVNGESWLLLCEQDRNKDPRLAKMFRLDPALLEEQPMLPHDRQTYLYREPLLESQEGYQTPPTIEGRFQDR